MKCYLELSENVLSVKMMAASMLTVFDQIFVKLLNNVEE